MGLSRQAAHRKAKARLTGQGRALAVASFIDWAGTGVWLSTSTVLMVRIVHLTATQVGLGLTAGGLLGLAAVWPVTMATHRWPARRVAMTVQILRGLFFLSFLAVRSAPDYYLAAALVAIVDRPANSVNQVLVSRYVSDDQRSGALAAMHVSTNAGMMLGALLASLALLAPSRASLDAVIIVNSLSFLLAAGQVRRATAGPPVTDSATAPGRARAGWLSGRFVLATVGCAALALLFPLFNVEIPLWLTTRTQVPPVTVSALFLLNTALVVAFQARVTRRITGIRNGAWAGLAAGACIVGCCGVLAALPGLATWAAAAGFVLAALLITLAEMNQGSAAWTLSFGLSKPEDRTRSLALFNLGQSAAFVLGPALCTFTVGWAGRAGFGVLAGIVTAGAGIVLLAARHQAEPAPVAEPA
ncbi:MAG TPA: MFS transporter [Streptosporangiaceae bacterium]|jgi:predicted MFS family arabinose efflux permease